MKERIEVGINIDSVNNPKHYDIGDTGLTCDTLMTAWLGEDFQANFYFGNILKYLIRAEKKNRIEDYKKALKYLEMLINIEKPIIMEINEAFLEVETKETTGVSWNKIIIEITRGLTTSLALKLDNIFRNLIQGFYEEAKEGLEDFIKEYKEA